MIQTKTSQYVGAGVMAVGLHVLFFLALVFGVSWHNRLRPPVFADLWSQLPEPPPPPVVQPRITPPPPPPVVAKPAPKPKPKPDIELAEKKRKEKALAEKLRRQQEEKQKELEAKQKALEAKQKALEAKQKAQAEAQRQAQLKQQQEQEEKRRQAQAAQMAKEQTRRELEAEMARQMQAEAAQEIERLQQEDAARARNAEMAKLVKDYQERIRSKILGYLRLPVTLTGNPEVWYQVQLMPDGEVLKITLIKSSGQPAYDDEVGRAILKASPLPLPPDTEAAAKFRDGLKLKISPHENGMMG